MDERPAELVSGWSLVTALVLAAMTLAAAVALVLPVPPLTSWILGIFVFVVPGAAIMRLTRLPDRLLLALTSVALSVAVVGLVTVLQAYLHLWSPTAATAVVIAVTAVALAFDPAFEPVRRAVTRSSAGAGSVPTVRSTVSPRPARAADEPVFDTVRGKAHARPMTIGERVGARSTSGMSLADGGRRLTGSWSIPVARPFPAPGRDATWAGAGSTAQPAVASDAAPSAVPYGPPAPAPVDVPFHLSPLPPPTVVGPPRPTWPAAPVWPPLPRTPEPALEPPPLAADATAASAPIPTPAEEPAPMVQPVRPTRIRIASGRSAATKARTPTVKGSAKPTPKVSAKATTTSKAPTAKPRTTKAGAEKARAAKAGPDKPSTPRSATPRSRPAKTAAVDDSAASKPTAARSRAATTSATPVAPGAIEAKLADRGGPETDATPTATRRRVAKRESGSSVPAPTPSDPDEAVPVKPRHSSSNGRRAPGSVPDGAAVHHNKY